MATTEDNEQRLAILESIVNKEKIDYELIIYYCNLLHYDWFNKEDFIKAKVYYDKLIKYNLKV